MSTPFPFEEASQTYGRATFDPAAQPKTPAWYAGLGFDETGYPKALDLMEKGALSGVAKGQAVLGGLLHSDTGMTYSADESGGLSATEGAPTESVNALADRISADAKAKVKAFTPDAATTGAAGQLLHGLTSAGTEMAIGSIAGPLGAAAVVGSGEGRQRYLELIDAGVDKDTALKESGWTGATSAAGAFVPGGFGVGLVPKVATGAAANTVFGMINRYADHRILDNAGYTQMAEQQKVIDGTQIIADLVLGAVFGGIAHLHETPQLQALKDAPGARDAALTTNLAIKDRETAPGIPVDPEAANAHQAALESSIQSLMEGKPVDVSAARVTEANFLRRAEPRNIEAEYMIRDAVVKDEFFGEGNERDVQAILEGRETKPFESKPARIERAPAVEQEAGGETPAGEKPAEKEAAVPQDPVAQALAEHPDLTIPDENGDLVSAHEALAQAQEEASTKRRESAVAAKAAITCYMRRGN